MTINFFLNGHTFSDVCDIHKSQLFLIATSLKILQTHGDLHPRMEVRHQLENWGNRQFTGGYDPKTSTSILQARWSCEAVQEKTKRAEEVAEKNAPPGADPYSWWQGGPHKGHRGWEDWEDQEASGLKEQPTSCREEAVCFWNILLIVVVCVPQFWAISIFASWNSYFLRCASWKAKRLTASCRGSFHDSFALVLLTNVAVDSKHNQNGFWSPSQQYEHHILYSLAWYLNV